MGGRQQQNRLRPAAALSAGPGNPRADELSLPHGGPGLAVRWGRRGLPGEHGGDSGALPLPCFLQRHEFSGHPRHAPDSDVAGRGACAGEQGGAGRGPSLPCRVSAGPTAADAGDAAAVRLPRVAHSILRG